MLLFCIDKPQRLELFFTGCIIVVKPQHCLTVKFQQA